MRRLLLPVLALALIAAGETPPPGEEDVHVVQPGETLGGIANREDVPRVLIIEANRLRPPFALRAGQKLKIPRTRHHTVAKGDTRFTIAYLYAVPWQAIAVANGLEAGAAFKPGQKLLIPTVIAPSADVAATPTPTATPAPAERTRFAWPLPGAMRRGYTARGKANYHDGLDIPAAEGTAVRASAAGKVLFAGNEPRQFGKLVVVDHGDGWRSAYAFLSRITVTEGDDVSAGERIGLVGHTGMARGSELHFELRKSDRPVDPVPQLPARD